jgi:hypothetical protein
MSSRRAQRDRQVSAQQIIDCASELRFLMTTAPLEERVLATLISFDDFAQVFQEFYTAQKAFRPDTPSRLRSVKIPSASESET